jgi:hypothetical protein
MSRNGRVCSGRRNWAVKDDRTTLRESKVDEEILRTCLDWKLNWASLFMHRESLEVKLLKTSR